jgi:hypothetical protein
LENDATNHVKSVEQHKGYNHHFTGLCWLDEEVLDELVLEDDWVIEFGKEFNEFLLFMVKPVDLHYAHSHLFYNLFNRFY